MMIHPPMLYSGYVAFTVPFAFAIGALITRRIDAEWIRATRRFALIAWALLGFGLLLGARWSYTELGWGGYWAWDPVENAALMPWLIGTAFLHSIMVQEKRGMLKVWNACLIVATFSLALLGTFLVRSGVLQSIHAFGDNTVGPYILGLIGVVLIGSTALIVSRLDDLRSEKRIDSLISREAVFLVNNLLLVGAHRGDLLGHLLPADLRTLHRRQGLAGGALVRPLHDAAGDPARALHRDRPAARLAPGQLGLGEEGLPRSRGDRRSSPRSSSPLHRRRPPPLGAGALRLRRLLPDRPRPGVLARRGRPPQARPAARCPSATAAMVSRNRRRYGGYIVHAGIAVLLIGIAASSSFQTNRDVPLKPGESDGVDGRKITYVKPTVAVDEENVAVGSVLRVEDGGDTYFLRPSRRFFVPTGVEGSATIAQLLRRRGDQRGRARAGAAERRLDRDPARRQRRHGRLPGRRQGLPRLRPRRRRGAARVRRAGGADAGRQRQPEPAPQAVGADRRPAGGDRANADRQGLPDRRRSRRPSA